MALLRDVPVPPFVSKTSTAVETDEAVTKEQIQKKVQSIHVDYPTMGAQLAHVVGVADPSSGASAAAGPSGGTSVEDLMLHPAIFEKDDDTNGHIHFITSTSNLRAAMYGIAPVDKLKTKLVAGKIVPVMLCG